MSDKLSHLRKLIERIDEKYSMDDESRLKKEYNYIKKNHFLISKTILKDILHNNKLEKKLWEKFEEDFKKIIIIFGEDKRHVIYVGYFESDNIKMNTIEFNEHKIKINTKNSYYLLRNHDCENEIAIEQAIYELNKIINKAENSSLTVQELLK